MFISKSLIQLENRLLAALPEEEYQRLLPHLKTDTLQLKRVLHYPDRKIDYVYFPHQSVISLVNVMQNGSTVEVGLVSGEGIVGTPVFLGDGIAINEAIVQVNGYATSIPAEVLKAEFDRGGTLQKVLLRYMQALYNQVSRSAACNRLHTLEQRLARWLLLLGDSQEKDDFPITQEFLSQMLGVRRSGVTEALGTLQAAGIVSNRRGRIQILDRKAMEMIACECYQVIKSNLARLVGGGPG